MKQPHYDNYYRKIPFQVMLSNWFDGIMPPKATSIGTVKRLVGELIAKKKSSNSSKTTQHSTASLPTFRFVLRTVNQATTNLAGTATLPPRVYSNS